MGACTTRPYSYQAPWESRGCLSSLFAAADEATILKAKRAKLLACHPDKVGAEAVGAGHAVGRITTALKVLTSPLDRKLYDAQLRVEQRAARFQNQPSSGSQHWAAGDDAIFFPSSRSPAPPFPTNTHSASTIPLRKRDQH